MPRIKLPLPDAFPFRTDLALRVGDINYGGHLGNDAVLALCHEARIRCLEQLGYSEMDIGGVGIIMSDAVVVYRSEGRRGEIARVDVALRELSPRGCDIIYRIAEAESSREIARAKTGIVFYDYTRKKLARLSEQALAALGRLEAA
ncbi:MAG: thioesterase family protein [Lentisphaerae bacterium]|jgi:acyl-CoA thioester hydrolase|nr:thioesterase family protein [Lentisphaerota bacterium]MBT5607144.1 thioesterase family protein [Lentisphaerota bacterium]MBT7055012.1 thioesterase family protein [Lentisphaerota bacterium]MBT7843258.1 thioesterase family protein [Lentisphaerota bacterium]